MHFLSPSSEVDLFPFAACWAIAQTFQHILSQQKQTHPALSVGSAGRQVIRACEPWVHLILFTYPPLCHLPTLSERPHLGHKRTLTAEVTTDDQTAKPTLLHLKCAKKKTICENTASPECPCKMFSVSSWHRKGPILSHRQGRQWGVVS